MKCTHIKYVTYVNAPHIVNAGLQGNVFHSGVVTSVPLTCCVKAISYLTHSKGHCGLRSATPAASVAWVSLWCTDCLSASTPQHDRNDQHLGTRNTRTRTLNWKCFTVKIFFFLCCFISAFNEGMSRWVLTWNLSAHRVNTFTVSHLCSTMVSVSCERCRVAGKCTELHRKMCEFLTGNQQGEN